MLLPPVQLTTCPHLLPAAPHTVPLTTVADSRPKGCPRAHGRAAEWVVDTAPLLVHVTGLAMVATEVRPPRAASPAGVPEAGAQRPAAMRARAKLAPSIAKQAINAVLPVELEQVPAGQGSRATRERCERCIRRGNRWGAERWRLRGRRRPMPAPLPHRCSARTETGPAGQLPRSGRGRTARRPRASGTR